jgi:hypothetical protein
MSMSPTIGEEEAILLDLLPFLLCNAAVPHPAVTKGTFYFDIYILGFCHW